MPDLIKYWELDCACHPDRSTMFIGNFGALLAQV
jgi:hypothetical protein